MQEVDAPVGVMGQKVPIVAVTVGPVVKVRVGVVVRVGEGGMLVDVAVGDGSRGVGVAVAPPPKTPRDTRISWSPVRGSFHATYTTLPTVSRPQ